MKVPTAKHDPTYGYLLVVEDEVLGYTGGLLIVCGRGRPLEFHCTEPVTASRAQRILFGPTLRPYLCGEQIGGGLLAKTKVPIGLLLTRDEDAALAGQHAGIATVVLPEGEEERPTHEALAPLAEVIDPAEPFGRVREAIREAQRLVAGGEDRVAA